MDIPTDAWSVVVSYVDIHNLLPLLYVNNAIQRTVVVHYTSHELFRPIIDNIAETGIDDLERYHFTYYKSVNSYGVNLFVHFLSCFKKYNISYPYDSEYFSKYFDGISCDCFDEVALLKLLKADPTVNVTNSSSFLIRAAAEHGALKLVQHLLQNTNSDPTGTIIQAVRYNQSVNLLDLLLVDMRDNPSTNSNEAIQWAVKNRSYENVKRLLQDPRVDASDERYECIKMVADDATGILDLLINAIDDLTKHDSHLLVWACEHNHENLVEKIISRFDAGVHDYYCFFTAIRNGNVNMVFTFINNNVNIRKCGNRAIKVARLAGNEEIEDLLSNFEIE